MGLLWSGCDTSKHLYWQLCAAFIVCLLSFLAEERCHKSCCCCGCNAFVTLRCHHLICWSCCMLIVDPGAAIDCVCLFTIRTSHHPLHRNCCSLTNVKIPKGCLSCSADKMWESSDQRELGDGIALIKTKKFKSSSGSNKNWNWQ